MWRTENKAGENARRRQARIVGGIEMAFCSQQEFVIDAAQEIALQKTLRLRNTLRGGRKNLDRALRCGAVREVRQNIARQLENGAHAENAVQSAPRQKQGSA